MSAFKRWTVLTTMGAAVLAAWVAGAQIVPPTPGAAPKAPAPMPAVATVGDRRITQAEFEQRSQQGLADYRARNGSDLPAEVVPIARRQMLESLIRRELLILEAGRRGLLASVETAEAQLRHDPFFQVSGRFDPQRFEQARRQNPAVFEQAVASLRQGLAARDLLDKLQREKGPTEAAVRARATRALTRAELDYLALRYSDFQGRAPEPRESEVAAYYAAHPGDFRRPPRASLSVLFVDQPALGDSEATVPAALAGWTARMKVVADSILAAVKAGRTLEEAGASQGTPRPNQVVLPDNFPRYWRGDAASHAAVFAARPGAILPDAIAAESGWLIVRVDEITPAHVAPLSEVANDIRGRLRVERRRAADEAAMREIYAGLRDSLKRTGYRVRYAAVDTGAVSVRPPTAADLDRFFRAHLADYSAFDAQGGVRVRKLDEVRDEVSSRWAREQRFAAARDLADRLAGTWERGRRDAGLEQRLRVRDVGPAVPGAPADTGSAGAVVGDSLRAGVGQPEVVRQGWGWLVYHVYEATPDWVPTFEQSGALLAGHRDEMRRREDEAGARRLFDEAPQRFAGGEVYHYSRAFVQVPMVANVPLTRAEVEKYHREHLDRFSAPELVRASHILISPTDDSPEADAVARARADSVLQRLRAGEDFEEMAGRVSDDPATRDNGGDLGQFSRGSMLPEIERAAFAMHPGEMSAAPFKSAVGYHILNVREYTPMMARPLSQMYADVGWMAAEAKAESLASRRADSLARVLPNGRMARLTTRGLGLVVMSYKHSRGNRKGYPTNLYSYYQRLETMKPGEVMRAGRRLGAMGYAVTWVDSIRPPDTPTWEESHDAALRAYRAEGGQRAARAKAAELDSLAAAGWSLDSLVAGFGGWQHVRAYTPEDPFPGLGVSGRLDTLVFGQRGNDGLPLRQVSGWMELPVELLRLRTVARHDPDPVALQTRIEGDRRSETDAALNSYFEELKKRYPVRILDRQLRQIQMPQVPGAR
jgi:parvulin-like peptidyl-prolyl isomerase